jgi:hypothetical protein
MERRRLTGDYQICEDPYENDSSAHREISESERIPLGTAKTRIRTAMLKLRAALMVDQEFAGQPETEDR